MLKQRVIYISFDGLDRLIFETWSYAESHNFVDDGQWHHWACTYNYNSELQIGTSGIYADGVVPAEKSDDVSNSLAGITPIYIATPNQSGLATTMCEIRIWNTARTQEEIQALIKEAVLPDNEDYENLLAYWQGDYVNGELLNLIGVSNDCYKNSGTFSPDTDDDKGNVLGFQSPCQLEFKQKINLNNKSYTIEFWLKPINEFSSVLEGQYSIIHQGDGNTENDGTGMWILLEEVELKFGHYNNSYCYYDSGEVNQWHHWACCYDVDNQELILYQDGVLVESQTDVNPLAVATENQQIKIADVIAEDLQGQVCEIRIWNVLRTVEQINEFKDGTVDPEEPDLLAYWRGDYDSGNERLVEPVADMKSEKHATNHAIVIEGDENIKQEQEIAPFQRTEAQVYYNFNNSFHPQELPLINTHSGAIH